MCKLMSIIVFFLLLWQHPTSTLTDTLLPYTSLCRSVPATVERAPDPKLALDPDRDPNGQQRKADFLAEQREADDINPHTLVAPVSPWTLSAGSVLAASLITGLNSDLPGHVTAQVTENTYDRVPGRPLLTPPASRPYGSYYTLVAICQ